jgi:predicted phage tail protein
MLTTIKLNGILGTKFVPELQGQISTVREAINLLCCNFSDFKHYVLSSDWRYTVVVKGKNWERYIVENSPAILLPVSGCVVEITPVIEGSGKTLTNIAMIGIGIALVSISGIGPVAVNLGWGLIMSGAAGLLNSIVNGNPKEDAKSTFFQSPGFNTKEGTPIPLVFGEVLVKSFQVISVEVSSELAPGWKYKTSSK